MTLGEIRADPETRRMTLTMLRLTEGAAARKVAKAMGVSIFVFQDMTLGRVPMSEDAFLKAVDFMEVSQERLDFVMLLTHKMLADMADAWPKVWREQLEPLDFTAKRALILGDKDLQNTGLSELLCDKSLEAVDPAEAVQLAELALLIVDKIDSRTDFYRNPDYQRRHHGYARGHLGHALFRQGELAAAETAFAKAIEEWMPGITGSKTLEKKHVERLASIVPGFSKEEALKPPRRKRRR